MIHCVLKIVLCKCGHRISKSELNSKFEIVKLKENSQCRIKYTCSKCGSSGVYVSKVADYWNAIPIKNGKKKYKDLYKIITESLAPNDGDSENSLAAKPITRTEISNFRGYLDTCTTPFTDLQKIL